MALALLGVAVLIVAVIALRGPSGKDVSAGSRVPGGSGSAAPPAGAGTGSGTGQHPGSTAPGTDTSRGTSASVAAPPREPLVVLNNTTITGLAAQARQQFEAGGWTVTKADNYSNDILSTCAYYDPSVAGAKAAARALRAEFPAIKRVKAQFPELAQWDSPIVVILTPDWASS